MNDGVVCTEKRYRPRCSHHNGWNRDRKKCYKINNYKEGTTVEEKWQTVWVRKAQPDEKGKRKESKVRPNRKEATPLEKW